MNDAAKWAIGIVIGFVVGFAIAMTITHGSYDRGLNDGYNRGIDEGFRLGIMSVAEQRINRIK